MRQLKHVCAACGVNVRQKATSLDGLCEVCALLDWVKTLRLAVPVGTQRIQRHRVWLMLGGKAKPGHPHHGRWMTQAMILLGYERPYPEAEWRAAEEKPALKDVWRSEL